jgi:hypothetical protein
MVTDNSIMMLHCLLCSRAGVVPHLCWVSSSSALIYRAFFRGCVSGACG